MLVSTGKYSQSQLLVLVTLQCIFAAHPFNDCATSFSKISGRNVVILHFFQFQQQLLTFSFANLFRPRDYHQRIHDPEFMMFAYDFEMNKVAPQFVLMKIVIDHINFTILSDACGLQLNMSLTNFPQAFVHVDEHDGSMYNLHNMWNTKAEQMEIIRFSGSGLNFAYCDIPKIQLEPIWNVQHLTNALDWIVWTLWICAFCSFLLMIPLRRNVLYGRLMREDISIDAYRVASMILPTPLAKVDKTMRNHVIILIWCFSNIVLNNCFSAGITSKLIKPSNEKSISNFTELSNKNYKIVFRSEGEYSVVTTALRNHVKVAFLETVEKESLERLLQNNFEAPETVQFDVAHELAFGTKVATVSYDTAILTILTLANAAMYFDNRNGGGKRCYAGQMLIPTGDYYNVFTGPTGVILGELMQRLTMTGITDMWLREAKGVSYARRVQDRLRVVSTIKFHHGNESENSPKPLAIYGRVKSMFFIYFVGVLLGLIVAIQEAIIHLFRKNTLLIRNILEYHP